MPHSIETLTIQTADAYHWVNRLIDSIPAEKWEETPPVLETNVTWQIGHLLMSFYYHSILVVAGHQMDVVSKIPLKEYNELYTLAPAANSAGKVNPNSLREHLNLVQQKSIEVIQSLKSEDLEQALIPTPITHPIAKTKFEALDWNIKHSMYHCGQLGILKRVLDQRFDFGLRMNQ